ncbi:glycosyltransferase [Hymenobacter sublimis]|uniref:Glycosyltransferase n=1 Tax=Hymenobacter sublimis TaxID=2933777 RepID=A0ABY4JC68_9BACT|nr:glycosyltransferase [Hymenobacter sublimis]UPL49542.1 glycosyltransferase [Hymenobacter sublimis]
MWHSLPPPARGVQASVIIPAKDEATNLPATLAALAAQTDLHGQALLPHSFEVLVLANNCLDQTARVVREFATRHPRLRLHVAEIKLPKAQAHVGQARRLLMDEACRRLEQGGHPRAFIASTDADTRVSPTWLISIAAELATGVDAVGGRILMDNADPTCPVRRCQLRDAAYYLLRARLEDHLDPTPYDPWPRHHQHFGANLALTARAYRHVGGLPVVPYLEDEALVQSLVRHDLRVRHSPTVKVFTSGRQQGRVAVGLSWQLRQWAELQQTQREPLVDNPQRLLAEWQLRAQLRQTWQQYSSAATSGALLPLPSWPAAAGLSRAALRRELTRASSFGQLWEKIRGRFLVHTTRRWPAVPLSVAIRMLREQVAALDSRPSAVVAGQLCT